MGGVGWGALVLAGVVRGVTSKEKLHRFQNIIWNIPSLWISRKPHFWNGHLWRPWCAFTSLVTEHLLNYLYPCILLNPEVVHRLNKVTAWISAIFRWLCRGCCLREIAVSSPVIPQFLLNFCILTMLILRQNFHFLLYHWRVHVAFLSSDAAGLSHQRAAGPVSVGGEMYLCEVLLWEKLESAGFFTWFLLFFSFIVP